MVIIAAYIYEHLPCARHSALHPVCHLIFSATLGEIVTISSLNVQMRKLRPKRLRLALD